MVVCGLVYLLKYTQFGALVYSALLISPYQAAGGGTLMTGLNAVMQGEVWRLVTQPSTP